MNKRDVVLMLNDYEKVLIRPRGTITADQMHCCHIAYVFLSKDNSEFVLSNSDVPFYHNLLEEFCALLIKALAGEAQLNPAIKEDIGLFFNIYQNASRYGTPGLNRPEINDYNVYNHRIWCSNHSSTWLYNDAEGSIFIEVTPDYRWDLYKKKKKHFIPYKTFIKNYQPMWKGKIPENIALTWLQQSIRLMESMNHRVDEIREERGSKGSDFDMQNTILFSIYGPIQRDLSPKHKEIFRKANLISYATWWENLNEATKLEFATESDPNSVGIYEQMPE